MKFLRCLFAIAMVFGLSTVAKAGPGGGGNFQMVVVDPSYSVNVITDTSFGFSLADCVEPGQVPNGSPYQGCFTGQNETGVTLTSLEIDIPLIGGTTGCATLNGGGIDYFGTVSCSTGANGYVLDYSGGIGIAENAVFTIAESGIAAADFPTDIDAVANTPEPSSLWLLSTGVLSLGLFGAYRRRQTLAAACPPSAANLA